MTVVARLVTHVDVNDVGPDTRQMSVSARLEAVLADGRRLTLLDDRGWSSSMNRSEPGDIWAWTSVEEIETTARIVVGPDEPVEGKTYEETAAGHWAYLADILGRQGVDAQELERLPHDVVLSDRLRARIAR